MIWKDCRVCLNNHIDQNVHKRNIAYGHAVYVIEFGKWDYREWAQKPEEKLKEFWKHFEKHIQLQSKDGGEDGVVEIVDWEGFSLSHHASRDGECVPMLLPC